MSYTSRTPRRPLTPRERANIDRIRFCLPLDVPQAPARSHDGLTARQRRAQRNGWNRAASQD